MQYERTKIEDFQLALRRIDDLLAQYEPKHQGAWKFQRIRTHIEHSFAHSDAAWDRADFEPTSAKIEEELTSAACRNLMALQLFLEARDAAKVDESPKPRKSVETGDPNE